MLLNELSPRTKEILLKFFDYLEFTGETTSRRSVGRFIRYEHISLTEAREAAKRGKQLLLS